MYKPLCESHSVFQANPLHPQNKSVAPEGREITPVETVSRRSSKQESPDFRPGSFKSKKNLIHLKAKRVLKYLRGQYHSPIEELSRAAGCGAHFLRNFVYMLTPREKGTIVPKLGRICKYYGIDIRYLADDETPLDAPFLDSGRSEPSLLDLSFYLSRRNIPEMFGAIVGWASAHLHARLGKGSHYSTTFTEPGRAVLSLRTGGQHSELEFKMREDRTVWVRTIFFHGKPSAAAPSLLTLYYLDALAKQLNRKLKN